MFVVYSIYCITVCPCHPYCERESTNSLMLHYASVYWDMYGSCMWKSSLENHLPDHCTPTTVASKHWEITYKTSSTTIFKISSSLNTSSTCCSQIRKSGLKGHIADIGYLMLPLNNSSQEKRWPLSASNGTSLQLNYMYIRICIIISGIAITKYQEIDLVGLLWWICIC